MPSEDVDASDFDTIGLLCKIKIKEKRKKKMKRKNRLKWFYQQWQIQRVLNHSFNALQ